MFCLCIYVVHDVLILFPLAKKLLQKQFISLKYRLFTSWLFHLIEVTSFLEVFNKY